MSVEKPNFLVEKYADLPGSKPVERAVAKKIREGEKGASTKEGRVEAYLDRLEALFKSPMGFRKAEGDKGGFELLKHKILEKYTTKYEEIPENYWKAQEEEARRRGEAGDWAYATTEQKEEVRRKHAEIVLTDQRASLEQWIDYFSLPDCTIPNHLKYWIFRNILNLKELVKTEIKKPDGTAEQKIEFPQRSKGTVAPFPDLNQEALGYLVDAMEIKLAGKNLEFEHDIQQNEREEFNRFLAKEDFTKLYAWANELMSPIPKHLLPVTEGTWVKYPQGSEPEKLVQTIRGRGTGWCTAGLSTARTQIEGGDFYVFYSLDDEGQATMPRIAIRMEGVDKIAEDPRGIAYKQNLDPYMAPILEEKLKEFGEVGKSYEKKSADMKHLTEIEAKSKKGLALNRDDLIFIYEINQQIEGFGYRKDPRVEELRKQRNPKEDAPIVLECEPQEIAWSQKEIKPDTKAYIGLLFIGIFETNIEHIYTKFPETPIRKFGLEIGGRAVKELEQQLGDNNVKLADYSQDVLRSKDFPTLKNREQIDLVRLKVRDLFLDENPHTTDEIYRKAEEFGLELCPAEVGPNLRLKYMDQPMNEWLYIAMEPIADRYGDPYVFSLVRRADGAWLDDYWAYPFSPWSPVDELVFRLRKQNSKT